MTRNTNFAEVLETVKALKAVTNMLNDIERETALSVGETIHEMDAQKFTALMKITNAVVSHMEDATLNLMEDISDLTSHAEENLWSDDQEEHQYFAWVLTTFDEDCAPGGDLYEEMFGDDEDDTTQAETAQDAAQI